MATATKRMVVPVELTHVSAEPVMERLMLLPDVSAVQFEGKVSTESLDLTLGRPRILAGLILTVPLVMSDLTVAEMVDAVLRVRGLPPRTGKPYKVPEPG